uniref:Uncharacterized protein n=1 Tax=Caenorhabditis japonica TaxID=281687 RepID=A0A8R1I8H9_CAEJA
MHKDINAIEKKEDTIVNEVVVHLQSNSEQLRSKAKRHQNDEQTSLQHLQESALTWLPLPPKFATNPSQERSRTTNDGENRKIMAPMTQQMELENDFHDHACSAPGDTSTYCNRYLKRTGRLLRLDTKNMCTYCGSKEHGQINCQHRS